MLTNPIICTASILSLNINVYCHKTEIFIFALPRRHNVTKHTSLLRSKRYRAIPEKMPHRTQSSSRNCNRNEHLKNWHVERELVSDLNWLINNPARISVRVFHNATRPDTWRLVVYTCRWCWWTTVWSCGAATRHRLACPGLLTLSATHRRWCPTISGSRLVWFFSRR